MTFTCPGCGSLAAAGPEEGPLDLFRRLAKEGWIMEYNEEASSAEPEEEGMFNPKYAQMIARAVLTLTCPLCLCPEKGTTQ